MFGNLLGASPGAGGGAPPYNLEHDVDMDDEFGEYIGLQDGNDVLGHDAIQGGAQPQGADQGQAGHPDLVDMVPDLAAHYGDAG